MLTLLWEEGMPENLRDQFEPILKQYLWLVPGWCSEITLSYEEFCIEDSEAEASTYAVPEYRYAGVAIHDHWGKLDEFRKRSVVIHELLHIPLSPMADHADQMYGRLMDGAGMKFQTHVQEDWVNRVESVVQDLANAIREVPVEKLPKVPYRDLEISPKTFN